MSIEKNTFNENRNKKSFPALFRALLFPVTLFLSSHPEAFAKSYTPNTPALLTSNPTTSLNDMTLDQLKQAYKSNLEKMLVLQQERAANPGAMEDHYTREIRLIIAQMKLINSLITRKTGLQ
jgi:hypothetical protein